MKQDVQGIDSEVAEYRGPGVVLSMDHGMYSGVPTCTDRHGRCVLRTVELDGREAQAGFYYNGPRPVEGQSLYFLHVHVPLKKRPTEEALGMVAQCETRQACQQAWEIFRTVRFTER